MLRGDGALARQGHPVLGCPVGTDEYVASQVQARCDSATRLIGILDTLLLAPEGASSDDVGLHAPDERDLLLLYCIHSRVQHLLLHVA